MKIGDLFFFPKDPGFTWSQRVGVVDSINIFNGIASIKCPRLERDSTYMGMFIIYPVLFEADFGQVVVPKSNLCELIFGSVY